MTRRNLHHIKDIFEEKTGVDLSPAPNRPIRKMMVLAAVLVCCFALTAFAYPLFSPLEGDELVLSGTYEGNGIVSVYVENGSEKELEFEEQLKLINWTTGEEVPPLDGKVKFSNIKFPANSSGVMTVDLSDAYDIEFLESTVPGKPGQIYYYLLLTNNDFLFGHDWICSFRFVQPEEEPEGEGGASGAALPEQNTAEIEEELRFYFESAYHDKILSTNENNFAYLQKVDERIKRFEGNVVSPVYPRIMVTGPSTFLDPQPKISEEMEGVEFDFEIPEEGVVSAEWTIVDGYRRLVGASVSEKTLSVFAHIPLAEGSGVSAIPLIYTFVFETDAVQNQEDCAFFYGGFHSFGELEVSKVYEDAYYAIYDVTDYFYTDLDAYLDYIVQTRQDLQIDEQTRRQIQTIYNYYRENLGELIYYQELQ